MRLAKPGFLARYHDEQMSVTPAVQKKMRRLAQALTAEDLRALAVACKVQEAASRQLPGLIDALIEDHHDALLDRLELRINEAAKEITA